MDGGTVDATSFSRNKSGRSRRRPNGITVSKQEMVEEHEELIPKLRMKGLHREAKVQSRELKGLRKRKPNPFSKVK